jgi:hypothetical protein
MPVGILSPKTWLMMMFRSWALMMTRSNLEALATEVARLQESGSKKPSIWTMTKDQLAEAARKELGLSQTKAQAETVTTLRERLREVRRIRMTTLDPMASAPKGLGKLSLQELKEEAIVRALPEPDPATRAKLIVLIRDDVAARLSVENAVMQPASSSTTARTQSTRPNRDGLHADHFDDDWEMSGDPARQRPQR